MKRRILLFASVVMIFLFLLSACSMSSKDINYDSGASTHEAPTEDWDVAESEDASYDDDMAREELGFAGQGIQPDKVITTIHLGFETEEFDDFTSDLEELIRENEGYIEYSDIWYGGSNRTYRRGDYVIRIPKEKLNKFKDNAREIGNLINESTSREDVTSQYRDTESRLKVVETKEERILALLEKADIMADIIELERELSNIIYEKEYLTADLMGLDDRIDYSTVNLNVEEVERYSNTDELGSGLGRRIKNAIKESLHFFATSMESLLVGLVYLVPFLIILVVLAFIGKKFYDKFKRKM